jgi:hypothetical protein
VCVRVRVCMRVCMRVCVCVCQLDISPTVAVCNDTTNILSLFYPPNVLYIW